MLRVASRPVWLTILAWLLLSPAPGARAAADLTDASFEDVLAQDVAVAGEKIAYGALPQQFGRLRVPAGKGPHPVVMLIHGGCWWADYDLSYMEALSSALAAAGYATWNIEFRRLGDAGGGWPGTFEDVRSALEFLRKLAPRHSLDPARVGIVGHSSGGQLALWVAAGSRDARQRSNQVTPRAVVGLAAITDLQVYRDGPAGSCHSAVDELLGGSPAQQAARYADVSPIQRLPLGVAQFLLQGNRDAVVDPRSAADYADAARKAGDQAQRVVIDGGHFDVVMARGRAFTALEGALRDGLGAR